MALAVALSGGGQFERTGLITASPGEPHADLLVDHRLVLAAGLVTLSLAMTAVRAWLRRAAEPPRRVRRPISRR